jgi:PPM family protein phosphatase
VPGLALACSGRSDVGHRPNNEDAWYASPRLAAVADGVGGAAAGEVASRMVIDALIHLDKCRLGAPLDEALPEAVLLGNQAIAFIAGCRPQMAGMGTTVTAVALDDDDRYVVANVGDSRTYLLRDGALTQLTRDESLVQELIDRGDLDAAAARRHPQRSLVLRALDGDPDRRPALRALTARPGDRLLLCSDGLSDSLDAATIERALGGTSRRATTERLIGLALAAGARDNVSVVVADAVPRAGAALWARLARA